MPSKLYSSKIIKAGALLPEAKLLLTQWDESLDLQSNLSRINQQNLFGKASRARIQDILDIFKQRYLSEPEVRKSLVAMAQKALAAESFDRILYFYAAQADPLLHDVVVEVLEPWWQNGRREVTVQELIAILKSWMTEGRMVKSWSEVTYLRVAQELLATLRDFGIFRGSVRKRLEPVYLPVLAFAYIAFYLFRGQPSGDKLLHHREWQLFFLSPQAVERLFIEAHSEHLLDYQAAGRIIRIEFPATTLEEYTHVILEKAHRTVRE